LKQIHGGKNTAKEYLVVRAQFVLVKKGLLGLKDEILGYRIVVPDTKEETVSLAQKMFEVLDSYKGVRLNLTKKEEP